jgi:hypothetical protein
VTPLKISWHLLGQKKKKKKNDKLRHKFFTNFWSVYQQPDFSKNSIFCLKNKQTIYNKYVK